MRQTISSPFRVVSRQRCNIGPYFRKLTYSPEYNWVAVKDSANTSRIPQNRSHMADDLASAPFADSYGETLAAEDRLSPAALFP